MADVKRQKQLDVINAKLPAGLPSAPGQPPIKGAQFISGGWLMPRIRKPNLKPNIKKENNNLNDELTSNPIPVEELKKSAKEILYEVIGTVPATTVSSLPNTGFDSALCTTVELGAELCD